MILSFNREKCFMTLDGTFSSGYQILSNNKNNNNFEIPIDNNT